MSEDLTTFQFDEKEWSMDREVIVSDNKWMYRFTPWDRDWAKEPEPKIIANDWVQLLELLNKVWDLADLIKARFSRGYAKTVVLSWVQRGSRACGFSVVLQVSFYTTEGGVLLLRITLTLFAC